MPGWVKLFGIILIIVVVVVVVLALTGGGEHGPGRHVGAAYLGCLTALMHRPS